jgi:hypothetical protein
MPWDEIKAREFPAFDRELDGISRQTIDAREPAHAS